MAVHDHDRPARRGHGATPRCARRGNLAPTKLLAGFCHPLFAIFVAFRIYAVRYGLWLGSDPSTIAPVR